MKIARYAILLAMVVSQTVCAMAMLEFMRLTNSAQYDIAKPYLVTFLSRGYKKVPDNAFSLVSAMEKLAFEKGYTYQSVDEVALEAAIKLGMTR